MTGLLGACAQQGVPPGGPEDQRPPVVVSTSPEAFGTLEDLDASVRFEFDERISERVSGGALDAAITVSPRGGEVRVRHSRRALSVDIEGGFRPGIVYRVTLQAVVSDMFGNQLRDAFELVFTTGGDATPTTLAGEVWDRITGRGVPQVVVYAIDADSLTHLSMTNRAGIYAFRYLPAGQFSVTAFDDRNRDGEVDATEVQGTSPASLSAGDTLLLDIAVLEPDTLPAVVMAAEVLDSVTVVIVFDDFLDPTQTLEVASASMSREEGSAPEIDALLHEADYSAYVDAVADSFARLDSLDQAEAAEAAALAAQQANTAADAGTPPPDSATLQDPSVVDAVEVADSVMAADAVVAEPEAPEVGAAPQAVEAVSTRRPPVTLNPLSGTRPGPVADTDRVLPARRLVLLLDAPVERDIEYTVRISRVVNISRLAGGGGEAVFLLETPPADTISVDTLAAPDTSAVQPDTGQVVPSARRQLLGRR